MPAAACKKVRSGNHEPERTFLQATPGVFHAGRSVSFCIGFFGFCG